MSPLVSGLAHIVDGICELCLWLSVCDIWHLYIVYFGWSCTYSRNLVVNWVMVLHDLFVELILAVCTNFAPTNYTFQQTLHTFSVFFYSPLSRRRRAMNTHFFSLWFYFLVAKAQRWHEQSSHGAWSGLNLRWYHAATHHFIVSSWSFQNEIMCYEFSTSISAEILWWCMRPRFQFEDFRFLNTSVEQR